MNHLVAIKTTKNMAKKTMKAALIFHMHLTLFFSYEILFNTNQSECVEKDFAK